MLLDVVAAASPPVECIEVDLYLPNVRSASSGSAVMLNEKLLGRGLEWGAFNDIVARYPGLQVVSLRIPTEIPWSKEAVDVFRAKLRGTWSDSNLPTVGHSGGCANRTHHSVRNMHAASTFLQIHEILIVC